MRLTTFSDYSLRVLIYLGVHRDGNGLVTINDIARAYDISENHLMKVVHQLAQQGYVETVRGNGGGMRLACAPERINIGQVLRGSEEDFAIVECFQDGNARCPIAPVCSLQKVLGRAMQGFFDVVDAHTLADLLHNETKLVRIFRDAGAAQ